MIIYFKKKSILAKCYSEFKMEILSQPEHICSTSIVSTTQMEFATTAKWLKNCRVLEPSFCDLVNQSNNSPL